MVMMPTMPGIPEIPNISEYRCPRCGRPVEDIAVLNRNYRPTREEVESRPGFAYMGMENDVLKCLCSEVSSWFSVEERPKSNE